MRCYITQFKLIVRTEVSWDPDFRAVDWLRAEGSPRFRKLRFVGEYIPDGYSTSNVRQLAAAWRLLYDWVVETHRPVNYYAELVGMLNPLREIWKQVKGQVPESSSDSDPEEEPQPRAGPSREKDLPAVTVKLEIKQELDAIEQATIDFVTSTEFDDWDALCANARSRYDAYDREVALRLHRLTQGI